MNVKELIPEVGRALDRIFKHGAAFDPRYPVIKYSGDSQNGKDGQPAGSDDIPEVKPTIED